jgi:hypothetical protein
LPGIDAARDEGSMSVPGTASTASVPDLLAGLSIAGLVLPEADQHSLEMPRG